MPRNVYWELYYHLVWRTKDGVPLRTAKVEPLTHRYLIHRVLQTAEAMVHAFGGIEDHVHMAVSLPPTTEIAKWVGDIKGACAHHINHGPCGLGALAWQTGYGVVSFGKRDLPWVVDYIKRQREHHAVSRIEDRLECITQIEVQAPEGGPMPAAR
ncbi:MAG: IS200/IS605 family transposase [Phycisphaerales bacterium]|nr:IS200/IS605 family transposase [Phycisphaerales bacterium]